MKLVRLFVILLVSVLYIIAASGCSGSSSFEKRYTDDMRQVRQVQAEQTAAISQIQTELRQLSGQAEELQHRTSGKAAELERTIQNFSTRVPPPAGVPEDLLNFDEKQISQNSGEAAEMYKTGLRQLRAGNFRGALDIFKQFVELNPDTSFSDNALFWSGICYERSGDVANAIGAFNDVYVRYPAEDRVPAALYYLGDAFTKMDSYNDARDTLRKVADDYPRSSFAKKARKRLASLERARKGKR